MNLDLEERLRAAGVATIRLAKSEKVKILARWTKEFPELLGSARQRRRSASVSTDKAADHLYETVHDAEFFVLPDDPSGMSSYRCQATTLPDLQELVSDTITRCDELVLVATDFTWSAVLLNHGAPQLVGRHFQKRPGFQPKFPST